MDEDHSYDYEGSEDSLGRRRRRGLRQRERADREVVKTPVAEVPRRTDVRVYESMLD